MPGLRHADPDFPRGWRSVTAPYGITGELMVFSTFLSVVYSIFRETRESVSSIQSMLPSPLLLHALLASPFGFLCICHSSLWVSKFLQWKKTPRNGSHFSSCTFPFSFSPLLFFAITCFLFTRKKPERHMSVTTAPSSVLQRSWRLHSCVYECFRDGSDWKIWGHCWIWTNSSWASMSEQLWMYVGQYVCMKGNKEFSQHFSLRDTFTFVLYSSPHKSSVANLKLLLLVFPVAWHIDGFWVCLFIYLSQLVLSLLSTTSVVLIVTRENMQPK